MASNNHIMTIETIDEWLCSTGYLVPENELQLDRLNKLYLDFKFKLTDVSIDVQSIIDGTLSCHFTKTVNFTNTDIENEINQLQMVARKGHENISKEIIKKMIDKHQKNNEK
jgi:hypothetical protein